MKTIFLLPLVALPFSVLSQKDGLYNDLNMALQKPEKVITLDLSGAGLTEIPEDIIKFQQLEGLFLQNNDIKVLPASLCANKNIKRLVLDNNPGLDLETSLKNIRELQLHYLSLRYCNIDYVPVSIIHQARLGTLVLSENHITELPDHIGELEALKEIEMRNNPIRHVSPSLWNCNDLERLDFSGQKIEGLDTLLAILGNLEKLLTLKLDYAPASLYDQLRCKTLVLSNGSIDEKFPVENLKVQNLHLQFSELPASDQFFKKLALNANIQQLKLEYCSPNKGLTGIARCTNLSAVELHSSSFASAKELQALKNLKTLRIKNCPISTQEISDLKTALPNTIVDADAKKVYPFASGPVANLQVPVQSYLFNAGLPNMIQTPNVLLNIPAGSFVDEKGNPVTGNIQVNYREFFDPVSIALSGINMKMDQRPNGAFMSSGGMFEINASQNGQPLALAPNSNVTAEVIPVQAGNDFGLFQADGNEWKTVKKNIAIDSVAPASVARNIMPKRPFFDKRRPRYAIQKPEVIVGRGRDFTIQFGDVKWYTRKHKENRNFIEFPELGVLSKYTFRYNGDNYKKDRRQMDSITRLISTPGGTLLANNYIPANFDYINIVPDKERDCYQLQLKFRGREYNYPVILEEAGRSNARIQENNKTFYNKWSKSLKKSDRAERIARYNREEKEYQEAYAAYCRKMDSLGFSRQPDFFFYRGADPQLSAIYMSKFRLTSLNKHNIDKIMSTPDATQILAKYESGDTQVNPELVIMVDATLNTAFSFGGEEAIICNPKNRCGIIAVIDDNTIGICRDVRKAKKTGVFKLETFDTRQTRLHEIKRLL